MKICDLVAQFIAINSISSQDKNTLRSKYLSKNMIKSMLEWEFNIEDILMRVDLYDLNPFPLQLSFHQQ